MSNINAEFGNLSIGEIASNAEFEKKFSKGSGKSTNGLPTHPAIIPENNGEDLKLDLNFPKGSFLTDTNTLDSAHTDSFFNTLAAHRGITKNFLILVKFGKHWTESDTLKKAQSALIRRVAKMVQTFPGLKTVEVCFDLVKKNWSQLKNAAYFYQLTFSDWSFHYKVAKGEWEKLEARSALDRRLVGFRHALQSKGEL